MWGYLHGSSGRYYDSESSDDYDDRYCPESSDDYDDRYCPVIPKLKNLLESTDSINNMSKAIGILKKNAIKAPPDDGDVYQHLNKNLFELFCAEDEILPCDISVMLEGIGKLDFPVELQTIEQLLSISDKASFGSLSEKLLDPNIRDTQSIEASKIKVDFNEQALSEVLCRIKYKLNLDITSSLKLHLHNMLVYGPGQFFDLHRDTEKVKNMVATLIFILPSKHDGGELLVKHKDYSKKICSSSDMEHIKLVMFYSDCQHEVKPVTEGFRIVLTYNVELESPIDLAGAQCLDIDSQLETEVAQHFSDISKPKRLVIILDHYYSEESLKWELMKGIDRTVTNALLAVGKKQNYKIFLALSQNMTLFVETDYDGGFTDSTAELYYCVDENNVKVDINVKLNKDDVQKELVGLFNYTTNSEGYEEHEKGWYGNGPAERRNFYRCACVVLLANSN